MVSLVVATTADPASINPAKALLAMPGWEPGPILEGGIRSFKNGDCVRILEHDKSIIEEDDLDLRWEAATEETVEEMVFLSKHVAVSTRPALTIHPIGVPHLKPGDVLPQGGRPGWAAPPCPRMGPWLTLLKKIAESHNLIPEFEVMFTNISATIQILFSSLSVVTFRNLIILKKLGKLTSKADNAIEISKCLKLESLSSEGLKITFEATHHGPITTKPTMFIEIGSTKEYWGRDDAARVIALLIWEGLGLGEHADVGSWSSKTEKNKVLLGIGGGHYVPRHMDVILKDGVWVGHLLSGYSLPMEDPGKSNAKATAESIGGTWKESIKVAFDATKAAFPGGQILAHLDQKSFKSWQKNAIIDFLGKQNIKIGKPADFH